MAGNSVSIRLGVEGAQSVNDAVREIGRNVRTTMDEASKATEEAGRKFDALARRLDPVAAANARLANAQAVADRAVASGARTQEDAMRLVEAAHARYKSVVDKTSESVSLNRNQMAESVHVVKAFADSVAAGADPVRALAMEGGRIGQIFSMGAGGVGGTLRAFGSTLGPYVLNPITLTIAALGAAGLATFQFVQQQHELERSLQGVGRAAGVSADGLRAIALAGAKRAGMSGGTGIEVAGALAASGNISAEIMPDIIGQTKKYANAFKLDIGDAAKELAAMFGDLDNGTAKVSERFGTLDARTQNTIQTLRAQGDTLGAQRALFEAFAQGMKTTVDQTTLLDKAVEKLKGTWNDFVGYTGRVVAPSTQQKIDALEAQLKAIGSGETSKNVFGEFLFGDKSGERAEAQRQIAELRQKRDKEEADAARDRASQEAVKRSREADSLVRQIMPELGERQGLVNRRKALEEALGNPEALNRLGVAAEDAQGALSRVTTQLANWKTPLQRLVQDGELATRAIEAQTFGQKASVAAEQARLAVLRESGDQLRAAAAAENARNELIAQGNRKGDEMLRDAKRSVELAGLDPRQRAFKQIDYERDDFKRQYAPQPGDLLGDSSRRASQALDLLTASATRASGAAATGAGIGPNAALPFFARSSDALSMIRGFESFRSGAYWDVNAYRAGYGSDTVTRADGSVARVTSGTTVSPQDAERDLSRRLTEFQAQIMRQIGVSTFQALPGGAQAALSSVAYNYGRLPSSVAEAAKGGDMAMLARAILGLAGDNGGINAGRRRAEAAAVEGSVRPLASRAGELADQSADARKQAYDKGQITEIVRGANQEIEQQNRLLEANALTFGKTTAQISAARKEQELLTQAMRQGLPITDEMKQTFADIARRYGEAAQRSEDLQRAQQNLIGAYDGVRSASRDVLGTFIGDLRKGQSASKALEDSMSKLADRLINMGLDKLISGLFGESGKVGGGAAGGFLQQIFRMFFNAEGGVIGSAGRIPLHAYAGGGVAYSPQVSIFGEGATPEAYVPLRSGAIPVTLGGRGLNQPQASPVTINVIGAPAGTKVQQSSDGRGGRRFDVVLDEAVARSIASDRGAQAMRDAYGAQRPPAKR